MNVIICPWVECVEDFKTFNLPINEYVELSLQQLDQLFSTFDIMLRNRIINKKKGFTIIEKVMYLSPKGKGFHQIA